MTKILEKYDAKRGGGMSSFISLINHDMNGCEVDPRDNVFESIWKEYECVILQSLVTSFGLDFIVKDQHGGDVDTIHNVRQIESDPKMTYKNTDHENDYDNKGTYDSSAYHKDPRYLTINQSMNEKKAIGKLNDAYTAETFAQNDDIDLDHVISAKEIHEDRGRVLAGLNGLDLANHEDNLKPADPSINRSMKDKDIESYLIDWEKKALERKSRIAALKAKDTLTGNERKELEKLKKLDQIDPDKMRAENKRARKAYDTKIQKNYYTSGNFYKDTVAAAGARGAEMGMRQAIGFIFMEIYMEAKHELKNMPSGSSLEDMLDAVGTGIKNGAENAMKKYKTVFSEFGEGFIAGSLSSITTTICNIFFTTVKNLVRCIRHIYASVVQAGKVLLFNPDDLMFGDRIKTATMILAVGASTLVGTAAGEVIGKTPICMIPAVGQSVQTFSSTLVSGLFSCALLVFLDRSKFMNTLIEKLNDIPSEVNNYKEVADAFERLAARLEGLDIVRFSADAESYQKITDAIVQAESEQEMNEILLSAYKDLDIRIPWTGDFNDFMGNRSNKLEFE